MSRMLSGKAPTKGTDQDFVANVMKLFLWCNMANHKPNSKYWKKRADKAWADEIKKVGCCEICGSITRQLHSHHIINRTCLRHRHDLSNGVCICSMHHVFDAWICPHGGLDAVKRFEDWLRDKRPGVWDWFLENKDDKRPMEGTYQEKYEELTQ